MQRLNHFREKRDQRIDYGIILSVMLLALISILTILSTTYIQPENGSLLPAIMQLVWYAVGIAAVIVIMLFDSEQLWKLAPVVYGIGLALLVLVLIFYDRATFESNGARSWFRIGSLSFQPSEIFKIALIIMLARVVTEHNLEHKDRTIHTDWVLFGKICLYTFPGLFLVIIQNDLGTTLVLLAIFVGILMMSGISWRILLPFFLSIVAIGAILIYIVVVDRELLLKIGFKNYQFARIDSWLNPYSDQSGDGFQLFQSMKAIGSGQLLGKGFGQSDVYVPVRESDMIFSTIGENFGFIGGCVLLLIYFIMIYQMVRICFDTKNEFYAYIAAGVICMILFHIIENVGMSIGLLPLTGIPLPFISRGGSALVGNMMGIGLMMSMRYHYNSSMFEDDEL